MDEEFARRLHVSAPVFPLVSMFPSFVVHSPKPVVDSALSRGRVALKSDSFVMLGLKLESMDAMGFISIYPVEGDKATTSTGNLYLDGLDLAL